MAILEVLVDIGQLLSAAGKMNSALETYRGAIDGVKAAANNLADKWKGDGQEAFVADQEAAYQWYNSLVEVTMAMIKEAELTGERYRDHIGILKSQM